MLPSSQWIAVSLRHYLSCSEVELVEHDGSRSSATTRVLTLDLKRVLVEESSMHRVVAPQF